MAGFILTSENQIQRLNGILGKVEKLQQLPLEKLTACLPDEKSWSVIEVHRAFEQIAYRLYIDKIDHALGNFGIPLDSDSMEFKARPLAKNGH